MGFFDHLQPNGATAIRPQGTKVIKRVVSKPNPGLQNRRAPAPAPAPARPTHPRQPANGGVKGQTNGKARSPAPVTSKSQPAQPAKSRKRSAQATQQRLVSSDEDSNSDSDLLLEASRKKARLSGPGDELDLDRQIRCLDAFTTDEQVDLPLVHAADIAFLNGSSKFTPAFEASPEDLNVTLQYPSKFPRERFQLVHPHESEDYVPCQDIIEVIELTAKYYLPEEESLRYLDEDKGIIRKLKRAIARKSAKEFREGVDEHNEAITRLTDEGVVAKHLDSLHSVAHPLMEHVLTQTYARTVSLKVESLRKYENGTDNVYGELLPRLVSKIFYETGLKSNHVMVDLGSGVANVVLQAALETGCESWGCEMMENACELAELQRKEMIARCRLWGLAPGAMHLERGDFLKSNTIGEILKKADVIVVNNQAFTPQLNDGLTNLFLDLKEGCYVVSLKSFLAHDHKITTRNFNSPVNLLEVEQKTYYSNCVSWTNAPGTYFIAKKDSRKLKAFEKRMK